MVAASKEHAAHLKIPSRFEDLRRKDDLLDEGVAAVFGIRSGEAELHALFFCTDRFTPPQAQEWLRERGMKPVLFTQASGCWSTARQSRHRAVPSGGEKH